MLMDALEMLGVPKEMVGRWKEQTGSELLPFQERLVPALLTGTKNVLGIGPTGAGKTLASEFAGAKAALENRKVIFLEPLVALVDEKYRHMRATYGPLGIKVVVSSRDHREHDGAIARGDFGIAIIVFEKLQSLLVSRPSLLCEVALVVADELQFLADDTRGPSLELLLTKIMSAQPAPRIIGLSAVIGKGQRLAEWLHADLLVEEKRPVELRKGVFFRGKFIYREHNTGKKGIEEFTDVQSDSDMDICCGLLEDLVCKRKEQVLWFARERRSCRNLAEAVAEREFSRFPAATAAIEELQEMEDTYMKGFLLETLKGAIAIHNSNLSYEERDFVERHVRLGDIKVVFATSTLAVGVNLPVENVIVPQKRMGSGGQTEDMTSLSIRRSDYENQSGRAGRLPAPGMVSPKFGRSIILADGQFQVEVFFRNYIDKPLEEIAPTLLNAPLEKHVLGLVASGLVRARGKMAELLLSSFTGQTRWSQKLEEFHSGLTKTIDGLIARGFVRERDGRLDTTDLGRVCATKGLEIETAATLAAWADEVRGMEVTDLEILMMLSSSQDGRKLNVHEPGEQEYKATYIDDVVRRSRECRDRPVFRMFWEKRGEVQKGDSFSAKRAMLLEDWINEVAVRDLEEQYKLSAGTIGRVALDVAWIADGLSGIVEAKSWSVERCAAMDRFATRIAVGLSEDAVGLASLRKEGVGRVTIRKLANAGLRTDEAVRTKTKDELKAAVGGNAANRLWVKLHGEGAATPRALQLVPPAPDAIAPTVEDEKPAPPSQAAESEVSYAEPQLTVDDIQHRLFYKEFEVPTHPKRSKRQPNRPARSKARATKKQRRKPEHMQRQLFRAVLILAKHNPAIVSMVQMAEELHAMGSVRRLDSAPEQRVLHNKITGLLKKTLCPQGVPAAEIDDLFVAVPGIGLRLHPSGRVVVLQRSEGAPAEGQAAASGE